MSRALTILLVATLAVLAGLALVLFEHGPGEAGTTARGVPLFPDLAGRLTDVAAVDVHRPAGVFTLARTAEGWTNLGIGGYPALAERVEASLAGLAGLTRVSPKTARPRLYPELGVEAVAAGAGSTRLTLKSAGGEVLADVIVGRAQRSGAGRRRPGVYVRLPGEERAWLADGTLDVHRDAPDWSERLLVDIGPGDVAAMELRPPGEDPIRIRREPPEGGRLQLAGLPPGTPIRHPHEIAYLSGAMADLRFLDVRPAAAPGARKPGVELGVTSRGGLRITLHEIERTAKAQVWAALDVEAAADRRAGGAAPDVAGLRARLSGWAFLLPRSLAARLELRLRDIVGDPGG